MKHALMDSIVMLVLVITLVHSLTSLRHHILAVQSLTWVRMVRLKSEHKSYASSWESSSYSECQNNTFNIVTPSSHFQTPQLDVIHAV